MNPVPAALLRTFKQAGGGFTGRAQAERIIEAVLAHYRAEITVLANGGGELFRIGPRNRHGLPGLHAHPTAVHSQTFELYAHRDPVEITDANYNSYIGLLIQALEVGRFRVGFGR